MRRHDFTGPGDLRAMQELASRVWSPTSRFHPGQLAWNRYSAAPVDPARPGPGEAISLWWEGGEVVGFGWAEAPDWLELQVDPARPDVAEQVLEWFEEYSDAPRQSALVMAGDPAGRIFAAAGFAPEREGPFLTHHVRALDRLPEPAQVPGYLLRAIEPGEAAARSACHVAAWSELGPSQMTPSAYRALMAAWPYRPDLDWVAVPEHGPQAGVPGHGPQAEVPEHGPQAGVPVASALVWLDPGTGVALLEPVGTVPAHRGRGLARAVVLAALRRARDLGARTALVTARGDDGYPGPHRLYRSLGFSPVAQTVTWTRSLD